MHRDHYTQASVVGREVGAHVALGLGDKATMDLMHSDALNEDPNLDRLRAAGAEELAEGWRGDDAVPAGRRWTTTACPTSGSTATSSSTSVPAGSTRSPRPGTPRATTSSPTSEASLLFAGDHVLSTITPSIGFEPAYVQQPLRDYLSSLAKVRALPDMKLLPAHGPVTESSHTRIDELVAHHDVRLDQSLRAVESGARTAWEVAGELPWTRHERRRDELGPFDGVLAAFETLAHLELLALQGKVAARRRPDGPVRSRWSSTG